MKLSLFSDYSLRVLMFAAVKGEAFQLEEVASAFDISKHHVAKIVQGLSKLGYLDTRRGRSGGIQLARPPEDIRIGKLVRETEDQPIMVECFDAASNTCRLDGCCKLKAALAKARKAFYDSLDAHTLRDFVTGPQRSRMIKILLPS
ncbi:MAG: Rrf2 family transcriptional regulator [Opitutaceae bacterium]|jgi:Rrf2 family nitric oxide-sensitive transcriptional repressor|nr:Rrf2 family transcriptional regulator [Opitutaceae bacterium]